MISVNDNCKHINIDALPGIEDEQNYVRILDIITTYCIELLDNIKYEFMRTTQSNNYLANYIMNGIKC